jgi:hypothetical protein
MPLLGRLSRERSRSSAASRRSVGGASAPNSYATITFEMPSVQMVPSVRRSSPSPVIARAASCPAVSATNVCPTAGATDTDRIVRTPRSRIPATSSSPPSGSTRSVVPVPARVTRR